MVMRRLVCAACLSLACLGTADPATAQGGRPQLDASTDLAPGEIQRLFDAMLVADAQQALTLTDQQYPEFLTRLRALQQVRRSHLLQRVKLMGELQRLTNPRGPGGDEATIRERLTALQDLESRSAADMRRAYTRIDEVLDVRQQARFRVLEEQLERRKLELLMRARQNRQQLRKQQ